MRKTITAEEFFKAIVEDKYLNEMTRSVLRKYRHAKVAIPFNTFAQEMIARAKKHGIVLTNKEAHQRLLVATRMRP